MNTYLHTAHGHDNIVHTKVAHSQASDHEDALLAGASNPRNGRFQCMLHRQGPASIAVHDQLANSAIPCMAALLFATSA